MHSLKLKRKKRDFVLFHGVYRKDVLSIMLAKETIFVSPEKTGFVVPTGNFREMIFSYILIWFRRPRNLFYEVKLLSLIPNCA